MRSELDSTTPDLPWPQSRKIDRETCHTRSDDVFGAVYRVQCPSIDDPCLVWASTLQLSRRLPPRTHSSLARSPNITQRKRSSPLSISIPSPCSPREADKSTPRSKLASMLSRWNHSLCVSADLNFPSTPSTPLHNRANTDDSSILPMSASPTRSYFGDVSFSEKFQTKLKARPWEGHPSVHTPVLILFPLSTALVAFCMATLPITSAAWPRTRPDLAQLGREFHGYTQSGPLSIFHAVGVISIVTGWMHGWSGHSPGSVLAHVLAGALVPLAIAIILLTYLAMVRTLSASCLATPSGRSSCH